METYLVTLKNPSANPSEIEEEYVNAESEADAQEEAQRLIASHPFNDVSLISVKLVSPEELYHETHA